MGRTYRQRTRKNRSNVNLSSDSSFVSLTQWMSERGWTQTTPLSLSKFEETGRGLMARSNIKQGDVLVSIPRSLLITTATVYESPVGCILHRATVTPPNFLCQEILACFLLWEKHLGNVSTWANYIRTLPKFFSTPQFLDKSHVNNFPWYLQDHSLGSIELVNDSFRHLIPAFRKDYICNHCQLTALDLFVWDDFLWGWCCVNTRAVFIDPGNVPSHPLPLRDRNCLALAPYLDMFNHSDAVQVEVGLNNNNNCYEITTLQPFKKHSELKEVCGESGVLMQNEYEKTKFCQKHELNNQLYIARDGLATDII
ncbi:SET domain-containing protein 4 [Frankliniella fusca]|uniref:SET domain-containing protein 4 n=1 Tax=Frankliniella fusca TaxID=407009 RepID=A0AAE1H7F4_9NEOP|nr:SET domain-containing protein 4 [Frankliniella fusca]